MKEPNKVISKRCTQVLGGVKHESSSLKLPRYYLAARTLTMRKPEDLTPAGTGILI